MGKKKLTFTNNENETDNVSNEIKEEDTNKEQNENKKNIIENEDEFIKNISASSVDLTNIVIQDSIARSLSSIKSLKTKIPSFQVICCQSGYIAHMKSMTFSDLNGFRSSESDFYNDRLRHFKMLYDLIVTTSIGDIDFETFLKITSYFDIDTLAYGAYRATWPNDVIQYKITCPECNHINAVKISLESLVSIKDNAVYENIEELIHSGDNIETLNERSLLSKTERRLLKVGKAIFEIKIPSLQDNLDILKIADSEIFEKEEDTMSVLSYTKAVYLLNREETLKEKKPIYFSPVTKLEEKYQIIKDLHPDDGEELISACNKLYSQYRIVYQIPDVTCSNDSYIIPSVDINILGLLFRRL
jgi:hypothetical protein